VVEARSFEKMLDEAVRRYQNRAIETAQVIGGADRPGQGHARPRCPWRAARPIRDELAFYDALGVNDSAVAVLGDECLRDIARELVATVKANVKIDWTVREDVRAQLRVPRQNAASAKHGLPARQAGEGDAYRSRTGRSSLRRVGSVVPSVLALSAPWAWAISTCLCLAKSALGNRRRYCDAGLPALDPAGEGPGCRAKHPRGWTRAAGDAFGCRGRGGAAGRCDAGGGKNLLEWTTDLRLLDAKEFEWLVGEVFRRDGWTVDETGSQDGPDGNVDLRLTRDGVHRIVQCKRWTSWNVGVDTVRAFAGTIMREGLPGSAAYS